MNEWTIPLTTGQILDRIFRIFKQNLRRLLLLVLLFWGPVLLGTLVLLLIMFFGMGLDLHSMSERDTMTVVVFVYLFIILASFLGNPGNVLVCGSTVFLVDHLRREMIPKLGTLIRWAFKRFFPMLGSAMCCYLILNAGVNIISVFICVAVFAIMLSGMYTVGVIVLIILILASLCVYYYFTIRLDFAQPATAMAPVSPGISQSWRLTRSRVARIFGVYCITGVIVLALVTIVGGLSVLLAGLVDNAAVWMLLVFLWIVVSVVLSNAVASVMRAVLYFDLETRNNAGDLRVLVNRLAVPGQPGGYPVMPPGYAGQPGGYPVMSSSGYAGQPGGYPVTLQSGDAGQPDGYPVTLQSGDAGQPDEYPVTSQSGYAGQPDEYPVTSQSGYAGQLDGQNRQSKE